MTEKRRRHRFAVLRISQKRIFTEILPSLSLTVFLKHTLALICHSAKLIKEPLMLLGFGRDRILFVVCFRPCESVMRRGFLLGLILAATRTTFDWRWRESLD